MSYLVGWMENRGGGFPPPPISLPQGRETLFSLRMFGWTNLDGWKTDFFMFGWKDLEDGILPAKLQRVDSSLSVRFWADSESNNLDEKLVPMDSFSGQILSNQTIIDILVSPVMLFWLGGWKIGGVDSIPLLFPYPREGKPYFPSVCLVE